jgi:hypothetical protein
MKFNQARFPVLITGLVLLFLLNCYLFRQNRFYKVENRGLILKNDSLIAVTIELKRQIASPAGTTAHHQRPAPECCHKIELYVNKKP